MIPNIIPKQKIVFLGDQSVGKTSVINRFLYEKFDHSEKATIGIDFITKTVTIQNKTIKLQLWDTAGQERFHSLIPSYIRDSNIAIMVYDIAKKTTFDHMQKWYEEVKNIRGKDILIVLIGNKSDLEDIREVSKKQGEIKSEEIGGMFFEVSAKNGDNINLLFEQIVTAMPLNNNIALTTHEITSNSNFAGTNNSNMVLHPAERILEQENPGPTQREENKKKEEVFDLSSEKNDRENEKIKLTTGVGQKKLNHETKKCC